MDFGAAKAEHGLTGGNMHTTSVRLRISELNLVHHLVDVREPDRADNLMQIEVDSEDGVEDGDPCLLMQSFLTWMACS